MKEEEEERGGRREEKRGELMGEGEEGSSES